MSAANPTPQEITDYLTDYYGTCALGEDCVCIKQGHQWIGALCQNWKPMGWKTLEDMRAALQQRRSS